MEILAYAQDEAASTGRLGNMVVTYQTNDDDGRDTDGCVIRKPVMVIADIRFADSTVELSLPHHLPCRGMLSEAALSDILTHTDYLFNGSWSQTYRYGIPDVELAHIGSRSHSGTVVVVHTALEGPGHLTSEDLLVFPDPHIECS